MGNKIHKILITRVEDDEITMYCSRWVERKIKPEAEKRGFDVIDLRGKRAVRKSVESVLNSINPILVLFHGHGDDTTIAGYLKETLIHFKENVSMLCGRIVHALTCSSANILGNEAVNRHGTLAFIGYKEPFIALNDDSSVTRPLEDKVAIPFMESAMRVSDSLIRGSTTGEAFKKSQDMYNFWIAYYRVHSEIKDAPDILQYLMADKNAQVLLGNENAKILN